MGQPKPLILLGDALQKETGTPTLEDIYRLMARKVGRPDLIEDMDLLQRFIQSRSASLNAIYTHIFSAFEKIAIPSGYHYLAQLVIDGYFDIVLTLNFDDLLERTINKYLGSQGYLLLVRNEHNDNYISKAIDFSLPRIKILKLRGSLHGRSFMLTKKELVQLPKQTENILRTKIATSDLVWIGAESNDKDIISCIPLDKGIVWFVNEVPPSNNTIIEDIIKNKSLGDTVISGELGKFNNFFRELYLLIRSQELEPIKEKQRIRFNQQVRNKSDIDLSHSDALIRRLATEIIAKCDFDNESTLLIYIHDPAAPGGSEVEKRIKRYLKEKELTSVRLDVKGQNIRWLNRRANDLDPQLAKRQFSRVIIIDSISFTGTTLNLATKSVKKIFPHAQIMWAVLVVSEQLIRELDKFQLSRSQLITVFETSRHDIFFPWGWTQPTGPLTKIIEFTKSHHTIEINQRPWGTIEILAENSFNSVRILTIRAGHRLSFHRHLVRDELFVALDEGIGVEFESEDGEVIEAMILPKGEYLAVPSGIKHRFSAHKNTVRLLEVSFGYYDQKYDIERFMDDYGRVGRLGDV